LFLPPFPLCVTMRREREDVGLFIFFLWWGGIALEFFLLMRAVRKRLYSLYPTFYTYLGWLLVVSIISFFVYTLREDLYRAFYWHTEFVTILLAYGVLLEIYRNALRNYAGAWRLARAALFVIFGAVVVKVLFRAFRAGFQPFAMTTEDLERNLRMVQGVLILVLIGVLLYYAIPIGRNLKGLLVGYGLFVSASVIDLALTWQLHRQIFRHLWQYFYSGAYDLALIVWCFALWSYEPSPQPEMPTAIERHYDVLAQTTRRLLVAARGYLMRAVRP
jgi:hypothetical protein